MPEKPEPGAIPRLCDAIRNVDLFQPDGAVLDGMIVWPQASTGRIALLTAHVTEIEPTDLARQVEASVAVIEQAAALDPEAAAVLEALLARLAERRKAKQGGQA